MQAQGVGKVSSDHLALPELSFGTEEILIRPKPAALASLEERETMPKASPLASKVEDTEDPERQEASEELTKRIENLVRTFQRDLRFEVHKETGILYVRVLDVENGEVLRELPMHELLDALARVDEIVGLLLDGKA
jgi:flagellar protein FlaG